MPQRRSFPALVAKGQANGVVLSEVFDSSEWENLFGMLLVTPSPRAGLVDVVLQHSTDGGQSWLTWKTLAQATEVLPGTVVSSTNPAPTDPSLGASVRVQATVSGATGPGVSFEVWLGVDTTSFIWS